MVSILKEKRGNCMKRYIRFKFDNKISYGLLTGSTIEILAGNKFIDFIPTGQNVDMENVEMLIPCKPEKVICCGLNYSDSILEEGVTFPTKPLLFLKPPSAMIQSGENIIKNQMVEILTCEAELGVVISKKAKNVKQQDAKNYVWGYIIANDVTAKDLQKEDIQWTRAKSFDTFLPLGSEIVADIEPNNLSIKSFINDKLVQDGNTNRMIFGIDYLISYISQIMTLNEGDIIITGTPGGYGKIIDDSDVVKIEIEDLGFIINAIRS